MKPMSRGERGKKIRQTAAGRRLNPDMFTIKNPLRGGVEKMANAQVNMRGAGLFLGFTVHF